jgi:hypothetical protein
MLTASAQPPAAKHDKKARTMTEVRKLKDGDWVIDLGRKWFRIRASGEIVVKEARGSWPLNSKIVTRKPTKAEEAFVRQQLTCN